MRTLQRQFRAAHDSDMAHCSRALWLVALRTRSACTKPLHVLQRGVRGGTNEAVGVSATHGTKAIAAAESGGGSGGGNNSGG